MNLLRHLPGVEAKLNYSYAEFRPVLNAIACVPDHNFFLLELWSGTQARIPGQLSKVKFRPPGQFFELTPGGWPGGCTRLELTETKR